MDEQKPEDASEGGIGQSASTAGLERTFVSNEFEHPEHHWKWTPLEMRWINERITLAVMAERDACAKLAETHGKYEVAQAIRMRSNVKFSGGAPLYGAASAGTKGYTSGGG